MLNIVRTNRIKKDYKILMKQGKDVIKLDQVMIKLSNKGILIQKFRDHKLRGEYMNRRECHIEPDWILIYKIENDEIIFERTGSHSELFE
ncbi:MAG: type II toxin-antitoxin system YafQ family toxin [Ignavibacteria bacterium]